MYQVTPVIDSKDLLSSTDDQPVPVGDTAISIARVRRLAHLMDSAVRVPLTNRRVGLDSLIGLIPGIGDIATTAVSALIVVEATKLGVRKRTIARMISNIGIDTLFGAIPLVGDLFDFAFKSNSRNVALIERELGVVVDSTATSALAKESVLELKR